MSLPRPVLAANWKMNLTPSAGRAFVAAFANASPPRPDRTVILFPAALTVAAVREAKAGRPDLRLGVQTIHSAEHGAYTGEVSAAMAADAGAEFVLVGHSERRQLCGETDAGCAARMARAVEHALTPMLCVGERIEQRERGETERVVVQQLRDGLATLSAEQVRRVLVAYEPVWAIGTGRTATPADAAAVHRVLRATLEELTEGAAGEVPILYGGSVNPGNAAALLAAPDVDGLLVGGASVDPLSWAAICQVAVERPRLA